MNNRTILIKQALLGIVATGLFVWASDPAAAQGFTPKTITVSEIKMTGLRDVATGFPKTITTKGLWIKGESTTGPKAGPFRPTTITVREIKMTGLRDVATGFPKTITTRQLRIKGESTTGSKAGRFK